MKHSTTSAFRANLALLPSQIRVLANKNFALLKQDKTHPSLSFKKIGADLWSVRVGLRYRALSLQNGEDFVWIWIGSHAEYDRLIKK